MNKDEASDDETISIKKAISFSTREEQLDYINRKLYRFHLFKDIGLCTVKNCEFCDAFDELVLESAKASEEEQNKDKQTKKEEQ